MILVAVDTSHARGSLVVAKSGKILSSRHWEKKAMHSEVATLELESALKEAGLQLKDLTHLSVNVGPGSFTGLRVGINLVRTLAYVFDIPVATFNTLEILAWREGEGRTLVANRAVQEYFYAAAFERKGDVLETLSEPKSMDHKQIQAMAGLLGAKILTEGLAEASDMVRILDQHRVQRHFFSWRDVKPLYVRGSEAEEKLKKGLLKPL